MEAMIKQMAKEVAGDREVIPYTDVILNKLRELQVDLRSTPAIFIGGGA